MLDQLGNPPWLSGVSMVSSTTVTSA